jgi:hypothetical protein
MRNLANARALAAGAIVIACWMGASEAWPMHDGAVQLAQASPAKGPTKPPQTPQGPDGSGDPIPTGVAPTNSTAPSPNSTSFGGFMKMRRVCPSRPAADAKTDKGTTAATGIVAEKPTNSCDGQKPR